VYFLVSKILAPFLNPVNLIFLVLVIIKTINFRVKNKILSILFNFFFYLLILIAIFPFGKLGLKYLEKDFLLQKTTLNPDNIIILAGSENINATNISKKTQLNDNSERLISGVKLAIENKNSKIYFVGGDGHFIKNEIDEIDVAKLFFMDVGFDLTRINFIKNTRNTIENIKSLKNIFLDKEKNILITSAYHMKRVKIISNSFKLNIQPYATDFRSIGNKHFINDFQRFDLVGNLNDFNIFFREIIGIVAFKIFY